MISVLIVALSLTLSGFSISFVTFNATSTEGTLSNVMSCFNKLNNVFVSSVALTIVSDNLFVLIAVTLPDPSILTISHPFSILVWLSLIYSNPSGMYLIISDAYPLTVPSLNTFILSVITSSLYVCKYFLICL